jgi:rubrerythrin
MTAKIDFTKLSLKDALDLAILIESEAKERYAEFADQMEQHRTPEAAEFFRTMIGNESRHEAELAARREKLFAGQPSAVKPSMLWDVEAPDYDQTRAFMPARQAMNVALRSEIKAHEFFSEALPHVKDPQVRELFTELRDEELQHQSLVRREIARLPPDPGIDPEAFVDEPVAQ